MLIFSLDILSYFDILVEYLIFSYFQCPQKGEGVNAMRGPPRMVDDTCKQSVDFLFLTGTV